MEPELRPATIHPAAEAAELEDPPERPPRRRPGSPRWLRAFIGAVLALALTAVTLTFVPGPGPAGAEDWAEEITVRYSEEDGDFGDRPMPDCGSKNITGDFRLAWWSVRTSLAPGIVLAGTEWDVEVRMHSAWSSGSNDGPDPLVVSLPATGGVERVGPVKATYGDAGLLPYDAHFGPGSTGPINAVGEYGYSYDANSSPKAGDGSDGVNLTLRFRVRAVGPDPVSIDSLIIKGKDATPPAGDVECSVPVGWQWGVLPPAKPAVVGESAKVDARYFGTNPGDRNGGDHEILVDVLANDDDPNIPGGPGNPDQVRLAGWSVDSLKGGSLDCGDQEPWQFDAQTADWETLPTGPCTYSPPQDYSGPDSFSYSVVQKTGRKVGSATVTLQVHGNDRPIVLPADFSVDQNTDEDFSLQGFVGDVNAGDGLECLPGLIAPVSPAVGSVTLGSDCKFTWDNQDPGFTGNVTFGFRACDQHPTVKSKGSLGAAVTPVAGYHLGWPDDLDADHTRLCQDGTATITVTKGGVFPPMAMLDFDLVDAGYSGDGVGPYTVVLDVLSNDWDPNGPVDDASVDLEILAGPDPAVGTAAVVDQRIRFTPADGFSGLVELTYRVCEDPDLQAPPYAGLPFCGVGGVVIDVKGNVSPVVAETSVDAEDGSTFGVDLELIAVDAEDEGISCSDLVAGAGIASATWTAPCEVEVELEPGHHGETLPLAFTVCDKHLLIYPNGPATPYGADGRSEGDMAPRCTEGKINVEIAADDEPEIPQDPDPEDPNPEDPNPEDQQDPNPQDPADPQDPSDPTPPGTTGAGDGSDVEPSGPTTPGSGDGSAPMAPGTGAADGAGAVEGGAVGGVLPRTGFPILLPLTIAAGLILSGSALMRMRHR